MSRWKSTTATNVPPDDRPPIMTPAEISRFIPISDLSRQAQAQALNLARGMQLLPGQVAFNKGDKDIYTCYLLSGEVVLDAGDGSPPQHLRADDKAACNPLSRLKPRAHSCKAVDQGQLLIFTDDDLDDLLARDQATAYEVTEFEGDDPQWMFQLLSNPAFSKIPPGNLHLLFGRFEAMPVAAGQVVVRQGEAGDYYYLIRSGSAQVTRTTEDGKQVPLANLQAGQGFGEEALISGYPRNATVTMSQAGELMRLPAADFDTLLRTPLVKHINLAQGAELIKRGAQLIDVRLESEYQTGSLKGSVNLPLYLLRLKAASLDRQRTYILLCQSGRRSSAAAFLLSQRGFDVRVLSGGLDALGGHSSG